MSEVRLSSREAVDIVCGCLKELSLKNPAFAGINIDAVRDILSEKTKNLFAPCSSKDSFKIIVLECLSNIEKNGSEVQVITILEAIENWFIFAISDLSQETSNHYKCVAKEGRLNSCLSVISLIIAIIALIKSFI